MRSLVNESMFSAREWCPSCGQCSEGPSVLYPYVHWLWPLSSHTACQTPSWWFPEPITSLPRGCQRNSFHGPHFTNKEMGSEEINRSCSAGKTVGPRFKPMTISSLHCPLSGSGKRWAPIHPSRPTHISLYSMEHLFTMALVWMLHHPAKSRSGWWRSSRQRVLP